MSGRPPIVGGQNLLDDGHAALLLADAESQGLDLDAEGQLVGAVHDDIDNAIDVLVRAADPAHSSSIIGNAIVDPKFVPFRPLAAVTQEQERGLTSIASKPTSVTRTWYVVQTLPLDGLTNASLAPSVTSKHL